ncbi:MAG TPA: SMC-Scp complex subunit ScpB [Pirellulales bacterium]|nr:SMC-Scp complex subunit ScpB [Pirellulales bacterium]
MLREPAPRSPQILMAFPRPAVGLLLRSVALRYQPRTPRAWQDARPRPVLPSRRGPSTERPGAGSCRRDPVLAMLEAVLLVANEPMTARRLCQAAGLDDPTQARTLVRRLSECYGREQSAFSVEEVAGGWQLMTRPSFGGWLRKLYPTGAMTRLSAPAIETLAVVAYRQPVVRAEVESIRGVQCGEMLRQLMDRDLVRIVGKSHDLGRPFLYGTTPRFLRIFGLRHLDDLPRARELRPAATSLPTNTEVISGPRRDQDLPGTILDLKEEHQS